MTNAVRDRKISQFQAQQGIPADAFLTYISQNTNYKISYGDFTNSLGVTGTIEQAGDPLGTPILNKAGSVNNIRNLESGPGITTSVSPQNGVIIEHNLSQDTTGVPLIIDLAAAEVRWRSLVAGPGINISRSNGTVQIAATAEPVTTKTILVDDISDLPDPVGDIIFLEADAEYLFRNDITTSNRFILADNTIINAGAARLISLTYTGTGIMFSSNNANWIIKNITINCAAGTLLNYSGIGTETMQIQSSIINADVLGNIASFLAISIFNTRFNVATNGFTFTGDAGVVLAQTNLITIDAGIFWDLGASVFQGVSIINSFCTLNGSSTFLSGLVDSGNILTGSTGSIVNCRFNGTGLPLVNIKPENIRWELALNDNIDDTRKIGLASQTNNAVSTVITTPGVPVLLAGTWNNDIEAQFSVSAAGRITYNGVKTIYADIAVSIASAPVSGTNKLLTFFIAKNGVVINNSGATNNLSSGDIGHTAVIWNESLITGDYIEIFVSNDTDATDILVNDVQFKVN